MQQVTISLIKDIEQCQLLWNKWSKDVLLWDLWEINMCFFDTKIHKPHFICIEEEGQMKGLLPLWYDSEINKYLIFGGTYPEKRPLWLDKNLMSSLTELIPQQSILFDFSADAITALLEVNPDMNSSIQLSECRYFINLEKTGFDLSNYLKTFSKKHRKNLLYDLRQLEKLNVQTIHEGLEHFDEFVIFNQTRFGADSDFSDPEFVESMKKFVDYLKEKNMLKAIAVVIDGKTEGIAYAAWYNGVYYVLNSGYNLSIKNLGKLLYMEHIKFALSLKAKEIDFLAGDTGWKELWNCEKEQYYNIVK